MSSLQSFSIIRARGNHCSHQNLPLVILPPGGRGEGVTNRRLSPACYNAHGSPMQCAWLRSTHINSTLALRGPRVCHVPQKTSDFGNKESAESASRRRFLAWQCELHRARIAAQGWAVSSLLLPSVARGGARLGSIAERRCIMCPGDLLDCWLWRMSPGCRATMPFSFCTPFCGPRAHAHRWGVTRRACRGRGQRP